MYLTLVSDCETDPIMQSLTDLSDANSSDNETDSKMSELAPNTEQYATNNF